MNITTTVLEHIFSTTQLENQRTLFEEDFYDTHHRYFDQIDDDYLLATNMSTADLILKWGFDWPDNYLEIGIEAAKHRCRPYENINSWKDISYEYLYYFSDSCSCLSSKGFKFFLIAAINIYLLDQKLNMNFIYFFIDRLGRNWEKDKECFSNDQQAFLRKFLQTCFP